MDGRTTPSGIEASSTLDACRENVIDSHGIEYADTPEGVAMARGQFRTMCDEYGWDADRALGMALFRDGYSHAQVARVIGAVADTL